MRLYLTAKTFVPDLYIDYIEVRLASGEEVSMNWDESDISRSPDGFSARYKGVCFGEEYANGKRDLLRDMVILDIGVYCESTQNPDIKIEVMDFVDGDRHKTWNPPRLIKEGCVTVG